MPPSCISKQPTSSAAPNRFFSPRTSRSEECLSPSKCSTTSTRCSSTRGPGDLAVLGDVADQDGGDAALLGDRDQRGGDRPDLGDAAGHALGAGRGDGLHRVEHQQARLDRVEVAEHGRQVGLGGQVEPLVQGAHALGAQPDLADRLLAADHRATWLPAPAAHCWATSSSRVDLPTPGLAGEQHHAPGTRPPPSTRSSSPTPVATARAGSALIVRDRPGRLAGLRAAPRGAWRRAAGPGRGLDDRSPTRRTRGSGRPTWAAGARRRRTRRRGVRPSPLGRWSASQSRRTYRRPTTIGGQSVAFAAPRGALVPMIGTARQRLARAADAGRRSATARFLRPSP